MQNIKIILFIQLLFFATIVSFAQKDKFTERLNFDTGWKFHLGHATDFQKDFNYGIARLFAKTGEAYGTCIDPKYNDSGWESINLPHDWVVKLPFVNSKNEEIKSHGYKAIGGLFPQNSIGWYRKNFELSKADSNKRMVIRFDGVFRDSKIWVNGFYIGSNMSGYGSFSFDITDYVRYDQPNVIVLRVDATQYEGWFYEGAGIYRHAWLTKYDNLHIVPDGVYVCSNVQNNDATLNIETKVVNQDLKDARCEAYSYITDRNGQKVAQTDALFLSIGSNKTKTVKQSVTLKNVRLWNLDDPYLYRVVSVVKSGDQINDEVKTRFGIRTITIDKDKGLALNGKSIKIQGVCCHQDHAGVGSAMPDYLQYYRIGLLKEMGANAYRASHNPPTPELLDACDSLGMLVLDETRQLNSEPEYLGQFERLITRDRNHPSVFLWNIGNEEEVIQANSIGKRVAQSLIQKLKELDPSRTCTCSVNLGNVFTGIDEVVPVRGFNYNLFGADAYHREHPDQPVLGSEVGSTVTTRGIYAKDSVLCYLSDYDVNYPAWASTAEQWWNIAVDRPWFMGGFVWTGFDYRGEPTPFQWPNINSHFGIMDVCGFPKNIYYYYQSWWSDKDVLHISPHWNWKGKEEQPIKVWVNSNAQDVELFLNGKSLGKKIMPVNGHLEWEVKYRPGVLSAVAHKNRRILKSKIETTGAPEQVVLESVKKVLSSNGSDAAVINVMVVDREGREVPDAHNLIQFSVSGDARILGVGNGDPSCHEPDQTDDGNYHRSLFNGKCQLILQAGKTGGEVKVNAMANGLKTGVLVLKSL
ncbi:MAG: beta-galactosidase GalA [Bacteroidota bacterium]|nr:beta-galactosidase GalA [Bacteroidota bacterium]